MAAPPPQRGDRRLAIVARLAPEARLSSCRRRPATAVGRPRRAVSADQPRQQGPARRTAQNHARALLAARSVGGRSDPADRHRHRRRVGAAPDERVPQCREPAPVGGAGATRRTGDQDGARRVPGAAGATAPHRSAVPVSRGWSPRLAVCAVDVHGYPGALHGRAGRAARHGTRCERDAADRRPGDAGRRALRHRSGTARHVGAGGDGAARRRRRHLGPARRIAAARVARRRTGRTLDGASSGDRPCRVEPRAGARCRSRFDHQARGVCLGGTAGQVRRYGARGRLSRCPHRTAVVARGRRGRRLGEQAAGQPRPASSSSVSKAAPPTSPTPSSSRPTWSQRSTSAP